MKCTKNTLAASFSFTSGVLWTVCTAGMFLFPDVTTAVGRLWFMGLREEIIVNTEMSFIGFVLGGISFAAAAWLIGYLFGWSLEFFSKNEK